MVKEVWVHFQKLYTKSNFAKLCRLETNIQALQKKNMNILELCTTMNFIWDELALNKSTELKACKEFIILEKSSDQFSFLWHFAMILRDLEAPSCIVLYFPQLIQWLMNSQLRKHIENLLHEKYLFLHLTPQCLLCPLDHPHKIRTKVICELLVMSVALTNKRDIGSLSVLSN